MDKEVMQMALDALEILDGAETVDGVIVYTDQEIKALRTALAQPEKEWVGLTVEDRDALALRSNALLDHIYEYGTTSEGVLPRLKSLFTAVEAKLKEKNI